jgi:hypothetical protein
MFHRVFGVSCELVYGARGDLYIRLLASFQSIKQHITHLTPTALCAAVRDVPAATAHRSYHGRRSSMLGVRRFRDHRHDGLCAQPMLHTAVAAQTCASHDSIMCYKKSCEDPEKN